MIDGQRIREARQAAGLTLDDVARQTGTSTTALSAIERGRRPVTTAMAERLAGVLDLRPSSALARHRPEVEELLARYGVSDLRLFGSAARQEDRVGSDLDLLVRIPGDMGLSFVDFAEELEALLRVPVDVVTDTSSGPLHDHIVANAVRA